MSAENDVQGGLRGVDWACAYAGFIAGLILTAVTYGTNAFGLYERGLAPIVLVGVPIVVPLLTLVVLRGGYRLTALGLFLAAPVLWISFFMFFGIVGVV